MDAEIKTLMRNGIAALKSGDRAAAHQIFLQVIQKHPKFPAGLVYAGISAPSDKQAERYLRAAQKIAPDHPAVHRGWKWLHTRSKTEPIQPPKTTWVARNLQTISRKTPSTALIVGGTLAMVMMIATFFFMLVLGTFYYLNFIRPAAAIAAAPPASSTPIQPSPTPSATPLPSLSPTLTASLTSTATTTPTLTVTPSPSTTPRISAAQATNLAYPPVDFKTFSTDPAAYAGKPLRITGQVVGFGEGSWEDRWVFTLLLGPPPDEPPDGEILSPVLVLGIAPDADFDLDVIITVYGLGSDEMPPLTVQGVKWNGAVLLGEGLTEIK